MIAAQTYHRSLFRLLFANILIKPIWILGVDRWVQNEVGWLAYGQYYTVWGLALTAGFLLDLGLTTLVQREAAAPNHSSEKLAGLFWTKGLLLLVYFFAIASIAWFYPSIPVSWLFGAAIVQALQSLYVYFRAWVTAAQDFAAEVWFSVLDKLLLIPLCLLWLSDILLPGSVRIPFYFVLQATTLLLSLGILICYLYQRRFVHIGSFQLSFTRFRMALPYALIVLLMSAHTRLDGFLLTYWSTDGEWEAGRFAAANRLVDAANIIGYLVVSFLLPFLSRHAPNAAYVRSAIDHARTGLLLFALSALIGVAGLSPWLTSWLYPGGSAELTALLPILFSSVLGYSLIHVYGTVLTARGAFGSFQLILGGALLLHVCCSAIWIPAEGALGSARSTLLTQVLAGLVLMFVAHRQTRQPQPISSYLVVIFTTSLIWFFW